MRKHPENDLQRFIVSWVRHVAPDCMAIAIPNAARRTVSGRPTNAVPGLTAGAPDLVVIAPGGQTLWIEVKAPKGRVSDAQFAFHSKLIGLGHTIAIVRSIDDVIMAFKAAGIKTRESDNGQTKSKIIPVGGRIDLLHEIIGG